MSDPWHGPGKPGFFTGMGFSEDTAYLGPVYRALEAAGSGAAKSERVVGDLLHQSEGFDYATDESGGLIATSAGQQSESEGLNPLADAISADAKARVQAMTPNPATTGAAVRIVHGLGEGAYLATVGGLTGGIPGAAALTGGVEGSATYHELTEQKVDSTTALESAGVTAITSAAGVLIPGGFGSTLAAKLLTGAGSQVGLGFASRYADHKILEANGYPEMAAQQKLWDSTAVLTDALLGTAFGGLAHLHGHEATAVKAAAAEPGMVDAALAANLAVHDRNLAVGVPVDPAATHAHQDALDVSNEQLLEGKPNDVSQTGVNEAKFAQRPIDEVRQAEAQTIAREYVPIEDQVSNVAPLKMPAPEHPADIGEFPAQAANADTTRVPWSQRLKPIDMGGASADELLAKYRQAPAAPRETASGNAESFLRAAEAQPHEGVEVRMMADPFDERSVHIDNIRAEEPRGGAGTTAMDKLTRLADEHGVNLTLDAHPLDKGGITSDKLRAWYERFGFQVVREEGGRPLMERPARGENIRSAQEGYAVQEHFPTADEIRSAGAEPTTPNVHGTAYVARALELDSGRVESLVKEHSGDSTGFLQAIRKFVDESAPVSQGSEARPRAPAESERSSSGSQGGSGAKRSGELGPTDRPGALEAGAVGTRRPAGELKPAASDANATGVKAGGSDQLGTGKADLLGDRVREALQEHPELQVTNDEGKPTRAADLLRQAEEDAARETDDFQKAVTAATNCFGRKGA